MDIVVYGPLRSAVGGKRTTIDFDGETVHEVLDAFVEAYPRAEDQIFADDGSLRTSVRVMWDDEPIEPDNTCPAGGELALFPAMQGG